MPRILVFDVNETLLDVHALAPHFEHMFGNASVLQEWFAQLLIYAGSCTLAGAYAEFSTLAEAALAMTAAAHRITVAPESRDRLMQAMLSLPPHPEVPQALKRLRSAGFRLFTLTNSSPWALAKQLESAGLTGLFERTFSVDAVRRYKPAPEPYRHVATELNVPTSDLRLIAAHAWDTLGALSAGCHAAFIARPGKALFPWGPQPGITGPDLANVADQLISRADAH